MDNTSPLVSVMMPFYNCEATLSLAIRSMLHQSYSNWELLLCDDGSIDSSLSWALSLEDPRVVVWSDGQRKGLAARLNECIDRAQGTYLARMDSDDVNYTRRIEQQVQFMNANPDVDLAGCQMLIYGESGEPLGKRVLPLEHSDITATPQISFGIGHPTWMGRAEWFRRWRYNPEALRYEDAELLYRSYRDSRFANLDEILYGYREMRGGFAKRLKTRMGRVQYLRRSAGAYQAIMAESFKSISDALIATTGLRYAMLRWREQSLNPAEVSAWENLLDELNYQEQAA